MAGFADALLSTATGTFIRLVVPTGETLGEVAAINASGTTVGTLRDASGQRHLATWDASGVLTDLGLPATATGASGDALNNVGQFGAQVDLVGARVTSAIATYPTNLLPTTTTTSSTSTTTTSNDPITSNQSVKTSSPAAGAASATPSFAG